MKYNQTIRLSSQTFRVPNHLKDSIKDISMSTKSRVVIQLSVISVIAFVRPEWHFRLNRRWRVFASFVGDYTKHNKTPYEKWIFVRDFVTFNYRLACCPITDPNFKIHWYTWLSGAIFANDIFVLIYTLIIFRTDYYRCVESIYTFGVVAAVRQFFFPIE